jgi:exodeoxyribonuclease V beta subunit
MNDAFAFSKLDLNAGDLFDHHAVIEASAGTGKTYSLIEMVMRLITEQGMSLEQILLVTYTDQATGELKSRIRARIVEALSEVGCDSELRDHLEQCLLKISQASIFTIHGFCHSTLTEFAFE